jgi:hypothetical protein
MGLGSLLRKARNIGPSVTLPGVGSISLADIASGGMTKQASTANRLVDEAISRADASRPTAEMVIRNPEKLNAVIDSTPRVADRIKLPTGTPPTNPQGLGSGTISQGATGDLSLLNDGQQFSEPDYSVGSMGSSGNPQMSNSAFIMDYLQKQLEMEQGQNGQGPTNQFDQQYMDLIDKGAGYLDPYRKAGEYGLAGVRSGLESGEFDVGQFQYSGQQPQGFQYSGQQPDRFDYSGSPVDRSIESYMKDDPSLAWQQEQMEKMLERRAAAKGGFGGGAIEREMLRETAGLLSQDYGNRFNRAQQERMADVGAEKDRYGRDLTGYGLDVQRDQQGYGRDLTGYGLDVAREQQGYGRQAGEYANEAQRLGTNFNRLSGLAGSGQQASTATGGMYSGLGSQLMGQQFQQSMFDQQLDEQRRMAKAQEDSAMWGGLGSLLGAGAGLFLGGPAGMAVGGQAGGFLGSQV